MVTVFLGDSALGARAADIVAVGEGSRLSGLNVVRTVSGPHRIDAVRLAAARGGDALGPSDARARVAVLLGGRSGRAWQEEGRAAPRGRPRTACGRRRDGARGGPAGGSGGARSGGARGGRLSVGPRGPDPRVALLAHADAVVVAGDDALAVDEAVATGRPVFAFRPTGLKRAAAAHLDRLAAHGVVRPFAGRLEAYGYAPLHAASEIGRAGRRSPRRARRCGQETNGARRRSSVKRTDRRPDEL
ncbi:mitochondrial fission ELM1 family protein [Chenggangzhangella methanolivorans]|uniref:Mitochondrial fission ELM1 family protein n=1 Tax=Chenggangzhangella methanolivorans TaxID=1437009 RepID=A0A9E6RGA8_9HYPH|nr:mitochondrial fission ELM1 family protein [Chenggangzhangella methanolivorans]